MDLGGHGITQQIHLLPDLANLAVESRPPDLQILQYHLLSQEKQTLEFEMRCTEMETACRCRWVPALHFAGACKGITCMVWHNEILSLQTCTHIEPKI